MIRLPGHASFEPLLRIARSSGLGVPRLLAGFLAARRRNATLGLSDYLAYRLFDRAYLSGAQPEDFLGQRAQTELAYALNPRIAVLPAWDKFSFTLFARAYALPVPRLLAAYLPGRRLASGEGLSLDTPQQLGDWLRGAAQWPVFAKPSFAQQSIGCFHFVGYRAETDVLLTYAGAEVPVSGFLDEVCGRLPRRHFRPEMGYLFQEVLRPHPAIAASLGTQQVCGVRAVVICDEEGVEMVSVLWKIAAGESDTDRFEATSVNNLIADVDPASGRVRMARGMKGRVTAAPLTGTPLEGFVLPDWEAVPPLLVRAAAAFPMMRVQHWDVALTDRGPCLLEVNDIGVIGPLQVFGHGLVTPRLRRLLQRHADSEAAPWLARIWRPGK